MQLCEGTAVVLDMVRPKAQLALAACNSEWGPEALGTATGGRPAPAQVPPALRQPGTPVGANLPHLTDHPLPWL